MPASPANNMIKPYYKTDLGILYCGDCLEVMKQLPDKSVDLVLTDPPYGVGADKGVGFGIIAGRKYSDDWDFRPDKRIFDDILRIGKNVAIFGGNYFTDLIPVGRHWIVWDK